MKSKLLDTTALSLSAEGDVLIRSSSAPLTAGPPATDPPAEGDVLIRRPEQARLAGGVSIDTIKRWEREGICPAPIRIGPRFSGQWRSVWLAWLNRRQAA